MRYEPEIMDRIINELEKVPNIRYVCSKVGIDHSTFYRWRIRYQDFEKKITIALFYGRESINDLAEANIIKGVQSGDIRCSTYWLSHNSAQYTSAETESGFDRISTRMTRVLKAPKTNDPDDFGSMFESIYKLEKDYNMEIGNDIIKSMVQMYCEYEEQLIELFYISYDDWRYEKMNNKVIKEVFGSDKNKKDKDNKNK